MSIEELARSAVDRVADQLAQRGTDVAGRLTDVALNGVYQLIARQLQGSATGRRLLELLKRAPTDAQGRARVAEVVRDEASSDTRFANSLSTAAAQAGIFIQGAGGFYQQNTDNSSGDFRGSTFNGVRNVKYKKYHIGNVRFGTGGLAVLIVGLVAVLGGGTAAVIVATKDSANLTSAVGKWTQPSQQPIAGWTVGPTVLTISANGRFTFSMKAKMSFGGNQPPPGTMPADFGQLNLDCGGTVTTEVERSESGFGVSSRCSMSCGLRRWDEISGWWWLDRAGTSQT